MPHLESNLKDAAFSKLYVEEAFVNEALERIAEIMKAQGLTSTHLACRMRVSVKIVNALLADTKPLTLRTVAGIFQALGYRVKLVLEPLSK